MWEAVDYAEEVDVSCCDSVLCLGTRKYGCYWHQRSLVGDSYRTNI